MSVRSPRFRSQLELIPREQEVQLGPPYVCLDAQAHALELRLGDADLPGRDVRPESALPIGTGADPARAGGPGRPAVRLPRRPGARARAAPRRRRLAWTRCPSGVRASDRNWS